MRRTEYVDSAQFTSRNLDARKKVREIEKDRVGLAVALGSDLNGN